MSNYQEVIVETYKYTGGGSSHSIRARPLPGQELDTSMHVECSSSMRKKHPVGTKLKIQAKITDREGGPPFLYTYHKWPYKVVTDQEAKDFIDRLRQK